MTLFSKNFRIKTARKEMIEPEEIIIDSTMTSLEGEDDFFAARRRFEVPVISLVFWLIFFAVSGMLCFLLFRVMYLQVFTHEASVVQLDRNYRRVYPIQSFRGVLYDKNFTQLTENIPSFALVYDTKNFSVDANRIAQTLKRVGDILEIEEGVLNEHIEDAQEFSHIVLIPNLSHEQILAITPHLVDLPEISVEERYIRHYIDGPAQAHLTGYVGRVSSEDILHSGDFYRNVSSIGKNGLEGQYEEVLRGDFGVEVRERDSKGNIRKKFVEKEPSAGKSILLNLDWELQREAFDVMRSKLSETGLKKGVFVAIDPRSGGILALLSFPTFDPNDLTSGISQREFDSIFLHKDKPLFNRVISGVYPPGSTIKPLIASAALQEGVIDSIKRLYAPEAIFVQNPYQEDVVYKFPDWKYHGWISILQALAESSNVFFYQIGGGFESQKGIGIAKIKEYLSYFGWGQVLSIDLPGEKEGLLPDQEWKEKNKKEIWYIGDTYHAAIGQGDIGVTPLQLVAATAAVANGGIVYQPQVVDKIIGESKEIIEDIPPKILHTNFIDPKVLETVKRGMYLVTQPGGTAVTLSQLPVKVGAKTGTAQPSKIVTPHSWVTAFAPFDSPEITIAVLIENGGEVPSPTVQVAHEILNWYFSREH